MTKPAKKHNYRRRIEEMLAAGQLPAGTVKELCVAHSWCAWHLGGACDCDPDVTLLRDIVKRAAQ